MIERIIEYPYPLKIDSFESVEDYLRRLRNTLQEEAVERIADFEGMQIDTLTVSDWTIQTSFKPSSDAAVDLGLTGYRFQDLHLSRNLTDDTVTLTVANAKDAYDKRVNTWGDGLQITSNVASVDYNTTNLKITSSQIDTIQSIATSATPTFAGIFLSDGNDKRYSFMMG